MFNRTLLALSLVFALLVPAVSWADLGSERSSTSTNTNQATEKKKKKKKKKLGKRKKRSRKGKKGQKAKKAKNKVKKVIKKVKTAGDRAAKKVVSKVGFENLLGKSQEAKKLIKCLQGVKKLSEIPEDVKSLLTRPGSVLTTKFQDAWRSTSKAAKKHLKRSKPPKKIEDMPRFAWDLQLKIVTEAGKTSDDIRAVACIMTSMKPKFKKMEPKLRAVAQTVQKAIKTKWETEIRPAATKKLTNIMMEQLRKTDRGQRVVDTTLRVTGKMLLAAERVKAIERNLKRYQEALSAQDKKQLDKAFKQVKASLEEGAEPGRVLVLVAEELAQEEIDKAIDRKFAPYVDKVIATASSGLAVVNGVIDGACGLIPEAGAAVCTALITRTLRLSYDWVVGQYLRNAIIAKVKDLSNRVVKYVGSLAYEAAFSKVDRKYAKIKRQYGGQFKELNKVIKPYIQLVKNEVFPAVKAIHSQRAQMIAVLGQVNAGASAKR